MDYYVINSELEKDLFSFLGELTVRGIKHTDTDYSKTEEKEKRN